jgi:hypothetical protein
VETSLNDIKRILHNDRGSNSLRDAVPREAGIEAVHHAKNQHEHDSEAEQTEVDARDFRIEPVTTVRQFAASIEGPFIDESTSLDSALEPLKDYLEVLEDELLER